MTILGIRCRRPRLGLRRREFRPTGDGLEPRSLLSVAGRPVPAATRVRSGLADLPGVRRIGSLRYTTGSDRARTLDLYLPPGPAPAAGWPVVLAIHGGGWRQFNKDGFGREAAVLAARGFAVAAPDYTLSRPGRPSWPSNFDDLRGAVAWLRAESGRYGLDPSRIAAMGESAGGHLAELLGTDADGPDSSKIQAVVSLSGPSDLAALCRESREGAGLAVRQFLGGPPRRLPASYRAASPVDRVSPQSAPMLLIHGDADGLVPPSQSVELSRALRARGVMAQLRIVPGGHDLGFRPGGVDLIAPIVAFLDRAFGEGRAT